MTIYVLRLGIYVLLPMLAAAATIALRQDISSRQDKTEVYLGYLFGLGVAGSGIAGFIGHMFLSNLVAMSIGWPTGSPFQLEMGFANLALGVLGLVAVSRRDGFREATVIAVAVIGIGATVVHLMDMVSTGNLAPGNTLQNVANLARPALLVGFLVTSRRIGARPSAQNSADTRPTWHEAHLHCVGWTTGLVSSGFGMGYAIGWPVIATVASIVVAAIVSWWHLSRT